LTSGKNGGENKKKMALDLTSRIWVFLLSMKIVFKHLRFSPFISVLSGQFRLFGVRYVESTQGMLFNGTVQSRSSLVNGDETRAKCFKAS
jgi:hypothetical protein